MNFAPVWPRAECLHSKNRYACSLIVPTRIVLGQICGIVIAFNFFLLSFRTGADND
jgi:hypothetical protein